MGFLKRIFTPIDLTKGRPVKVIAAFLLPILLSMVFQQIYTLTDAIIVGQTLSEPEIAGVSNSGTITFLVLYLGIGTSDGFSVVISKAIGEKDEATARKSFFVQIVLSFLLSVLIAIIACLCIPFLLRLVGVTPSEDAYMQQEYEAGYAYLFVIFAACGAQIFYNMIVGVLRAKGDSLVPFLFLAVGVVLNIGLDLLFIIVFKMGPSGAAYATVISQGVAAIAGFVYALCRYKELRFRKEDLKIETRFYLHHLRLGLPTGMQYAILAVGCIMMTSAVVSFDVSSSGVTTQGLPAQIGYAAACKVFNLLSCPYSAIGSATITYVSQNLGANDFGRIKKGIASTFLIGMAFYVALNLGVGLLITIGGAYQYLFLSSSVITEASIRYGNAYLYVAMPCMFILMILYVVRSALQGMEKPLMAFVAGGAELLARFCFCFLLPWLIYGKNLDSAAPFWLYVLVCFADPFAWLLSPLTTFVSLIKAIKKGERKAAISMAQENPSSPIEAIESEK